MTGAPADSDATTTATEEELQLAPQPQAIGNPTRRETCDDDPLRGNPRDASDLSERFQCELGLRDRSMSCPARRRVHRIDDDVE
eukprot:4406680-Pyramimonas_sp.AAC.1